VTSGALPGYPGGLLVIQDGYNVTPPANQNFKLVAWRDIAHRLGLR
jgi:3-phytase